MNDALNALVPLDSAANQVGMSPQELLDLCLSADIDAHAEKWGETYWVRRHSIEKLKARAAKLAEAERVTPFVEVPL